MVTMSDGEAGHFVKGLSKIHETIRSPKTSTKRPLAALFVEARMMRKSIPNQISDHLQ